MKFLQSFYLNNRFFLVIIGIVLLFALGFIVQALVGIAKIALLVLGVLCIIDLLLIYGTRNGLKGARSANEKLSNGDENKIQLHIQNHYSFLTFLKIIDEIPHQFQIRNFLFQTTLEPRTNKTLEYKLRPVKRGEYKFGALNVYISTKIGFIARRYRFAQQQMIPVYPSYLQMRKYELLAISNRLTEAGIKKIRRVGHNQEFEQIKEYVQGDDMRTINWKATARRNNLMVNHYQDEKSQQVYCIVDKGRVMKMPFEQMSLLDYAINASLVISSIAMNKDDKAGLITFNRQIESILPARKGLAQMQSILEVLYKQNTAFKESNFEKLYITLKRKIKHRSLIILFTNFESESALTRQLPYLKAIAGNHLLLVVLFENTELRSLLEAPAYSTEEVYLKTIAEKFDFEKRLIVKELRKCGVHAVLSTPQSLTVNTINKYLEFKSRGLI
ncbi:DUF58 domain-containing protein [Microscilla marina]|uniref:DUF58 domain-containing protein n=1 Tax=Microscilla marina ATCC 23134 TaxID=313606 RepID=A2A040_MICM2|nr:DUF58 domain-containing protein [Microscilla marina]EAY23998.1 protein of unknown function [Microscilla marina ATCC 23134]